LTVPGFVACKQAGYRVRQECNKTATKTNVQTMKVYLGSLLLGSLNLSIDGFYSPSLSVNSRQSAVQSLHLLSDGPSADVQVQGLGYSGDWSAHLDESKGLVYYFNRITGNSQWELPEDADFSSLNWFKSLSAAKKLEMREKLKTYLEERLNDSSTDFIGTLQEDRRDAEWKRNDAAQKLKSTLEKCSQTTVDGVSEADLIQAEKPDGFPDFNFKVSASKQNVTQEHQKQHAEWSTSAKVNVPGKRTTKTANKGNQKGAQSALPIVQQDDWSALFDVQSGCVFYHNENVGTTQWDPPSPDFPKIIMEGGLPKVIGSNSNISMERALGMTFSEAADDDKAREWEEAKRRERERKAKLRSEGTSNVYEAAKSAELKRLEDEKKQPLKQPVPPKEQPKFVTPENAKTFVAPLTKTLYDILECGQGTSRVDLKKSYINLARQYHPDALLQNGLTYNEETEQKFVEISKAWKILGDTTTRRRYDRKLQGKEISSKAGNLFESFVAGAALWIDEALEGAEIDLDMDI